MSVRLKFPRGSSFSFLRQFVRDGSPVDITGKTLSAYCKASPSDADADALFSPTIAAVNTTLGIVRVTLNGADTADLSLLMRYFWQARAAISASDILAPEALQGPVELTPFTDLSLVPPAVDETLVPSEASDLTELTDSNFLGIRSDITSAALHRAVVTAGRTLPWVIATLENNTWQTWTLRTRSGESDDTDNYRVPTDYNASTNPVIWVHSALG